MLVVMKRNKREKLFGCLGWLVLFLIAILWCLLLFRGEIGCIPFGPVGIATCAEQW
jgi:hypothetical protein